MIKKTFPVIVVILLLNHAAYAQKRNNLRFAGIFFDNMMTTSHGGEEGTFLNKFGYIAGYERLVGSRLAVGFYYTNFFGTDNAYVSSSDGYTPGIIQNYKFEHGDFGEDGFSLGYESKYYFDTFDEDGANAGYLGFSLQHARFSRRLRNAYYYNNSSGSKIQDFPEYNYGITRLGVKLGVMTTGTLSSDFYFGINFNMSSDQSGVWYSPSTARPVSYTIGWIVGVPF